MNRFEESLKALGELRWNVSMDYFDYMGNNHYCDIIEKDLRTLAKIEEEIGIGIEILYKALKNGVYIPFFNGIESLKDYKLDFERKAFIISKYFSGNSYGEVLYFKDYGKTWALTKEEIKP